MKCPNCGKEITNDSLYCEYCGTKISAKKSNRGLWIIAFLVMVAIAVVAVVIFAGGGEKGYDYDYAFAPAEPEPSYEIEYDERGVEAVSSASELKEEVQKESDELNPIVNRLSQSDINSNLKPAAIAYNFVCAICDENWSLMYSYMNEEGVEWLYDEVREKGFSNLEDFFSEYGSKYNILGWQDYLQNGWEIAVLYMQEEGNYEDGLKHMKIYVHCVPSYEIGCKGFQEITRCNTANPKVMLVKENGQWRVEGFK